MEKTTENETETGVIECVFETKVSKKQRGSVSKPPIHVEP